MMLDQIILGDSRQLASLVDGRQPSVDTIITSPPYGDLINYRMDSQLGFGQNWEQYLEDLTAILRKCYLILKDTGSLWLVVDAWHDRKTYRLFPMEIANKASAIGWKLRDIIIWDKQHTLPYYSHGQFRPIYEYILFFTKSDGYKFYRDRIREVDGLSMWWVDFPERFSPLGKSPTNIWHFPIRPQGGGWRGKREIWRHACPFPTELVAQIIELTTDKGDLVFDPFAGSGVVLATAAAMQRHYLGIELNPEFVDQFKSIVRDEVAKEYKQLLKKRKLMDGLNGSFGSMILRLRALKYARKVTEALNSHIHKSTLPRSASRTKLLLCVCIAAIPNSYERGEEFDVSLYFLYSGKKEQITCAVKEVEKLLRKFPLGTYGINPSIKSFKRKADLRKALPAKLNLYSYPKIMMRSFQSIQRVEKWLSDEVDFSNGKVVPILANLKVDTSWMLDKYGETLLS